MRHPQIVPRPSNCTSIHFPKRLLLLLRTVFALPKDSKMGLAASSFSSIALSLPATSAKNCRHFLVASVFPAPDSPEMMMAWSCRSVTKPL